MRKLIETNKIVEILCPYCGSKKSDVGYFVETSTGCVTTEEWDCCSCGKATYVKRYDPPAKIDIPMEGATIYGSAPISTKPTVKCPYCGSKSTKKISTLSRIGSFATLGFAGKKVGKQWHCNNCKSDF